MLIATMEQQKLAMLAIIQQLTELGIDLQAVAEGARLRILGSEALCRLPADFRVRSAGAIDELIRQAAAAPTPVDSDRA